MGTSKKFQDGFRAFVGRMDELVVMADKTAESLRAIEEAEEAPAEVRRRAATARASVAESALKLRQATVRIAAIVDPDLAADMVR